MKYIFIFVAVLISSCFNLSKDAGLRLEKEWKKHLAPKDSIINMLQTGKTFALQSSETQGIDHERFKEFDYWKEVDKNYFEYAGSKEFSNPGEDGGTLTTLEIYKAIKPGETEIKFYKKHYYGNRNPTDAGYAKDTIAYLYNTYKFKVN